MDTETCERSCEKERHIETGIYERHVDKGRKPGHKSAREED